MIRWGQHTSGVGYSIMKNTGDIPHIEGAWLKNFRDGLHTIGGTLEVMEEWKQPIQWAGDKHLMQEFMESHAVGNKDLEKINYCRMYLKVEHVTDIATSDGKKIHPQLLEKPGRCLNNQKHTVEWPRQQRPNQQSWQLLYAALRAM
eukprot:12133881-Ditylum_brightwellii.AAC.1